MFIRLLATIIRAVWITIEVPYVRRFMIQSRKDWDKHSGRLWDIANALEPIGMVLGFTGVGRIRTGSSLFALLGLLLLVAGIAIRWTAIYTLGEYFTSTVIIKDDHRLVRAGLYKYLRHPAYAGPLVAHLGLGLSFSNWFSLVLSFVPYLVAVAYRIRVEEKALGDEFGEQYLAYSREAKRLIPKLF